ncbi:MAG: hypothetical protein ACYDBZ_06845 [Steroidobacteraceae bacterium]
MPKHGLKSRQLSQLKRALQGALVAGALAGCGGGASSPGAMSAAAGVNAPLAIDQSNSTATAAEAIVTPTALSSGATAAVSATPAAVVPVALSAVDRRVAQGMLPAANARPAGAGTVTIPCLVGGSVTVVTAADGTTLTVTFAECSEAAGTSVNGTQTYTNFTLTMTSASDSISANVTDALTIVVGAHSYAEMGDYAFAFAADKTAGGALTTETFDLSGSSLAVAVSSGGAVSDSVTFSNFNFNFEEDQTVSPHQLYSALSFTLASTRLNGTIVVTTTQEFKQIDDPSVARLYPYTGQLLITGADKQRLQVTILGDETFVPPAGEGQIELQLDPGSGSFGPPIWLSWATLTAAG